MAKKVLVVDDELATVKLLETSLNAKGYDVITASDGEGCLKKATEEKPDLILLDILLPGLNGFEVSRRLKNDEKTKNIPIIMLTALAQEENLSQGLQTGASCFITKPYNLADLISEIKRELAE